MDELFFLEPKGGKLHGVLVGVPMPDGLADKTLCVRTCLNSCKKNTI